jgi:periplasmic protein TonB
MFSGLAVEQDPVRRWTALASFLLQAALAAATLAYPLLHPGSLPQVVHPRLLPLSAEATASEPQTNLHRGTNSAPILPIMVSAHEIRHRPASSDGQAAGPAPSTDFNRLIGGNGEGLPGLIFTEQLQPLPTLSVRPEAVRRSLIIEGNLIHKVEPQYPTLAKQLHIEGTVMLTALISREGTIERLEVERGPALLAKAALEAVRQWRYRPFFLNHQPIEVETEITVNFVLQR